MSLNTFDEGHLTEIKEFAHCFQFMLLRKGFEVVSVYHGDDFKTFEVFPLHFSCIII